MVEDAEWVIVAYGISARVAKQVVIDLREEGIKLGSSGPSRSSPSRKRAFANLDYTKVKA